MYNKQGRRDEAEVLDVQAIETSKLGVEDLGTLINMYNPTKS
jgi:hypothetical protein